MGESAPLSDGPFRLAGWDVDPRQGVLRAGETVRRLEPQLMDLLIYLASRPGEVISKTDILERVWGGRAVSDDALTGSIYQLRKALGDDARSPRFIATIPKRGYRLLVTVEATRPARRWSPRGAVLVGTLAILALTLVGAGAVLWPSAAGRTVSSEAQEAYRQGRTLLDSQNPATVEQARLYFERALALAPGFPPALAGRSEIDLLRADFGQGRAAELLPKARGDALAALAGDPDLPDAHLALGMVFAFGDRDLPRAGKEVRRAVELQPGSPEARRCLALVLAADGKRGEAVAEARRAVALAPLSLQAHRTLVEVLLLARDYPAAIREAHRLLEISPDLDHPHYSMAWAYALQGRDREAWAAFRDAFQAAGLPEESLRRLDAVFAAEGLPGIYRRVIRWSEGQALSPFRWSDLVTFYAAAGEPDRAFALLEQAAARGETGLVWLRESPLADLLRSDPRFPRLIRRLGLDRRG